MACGSRSLSVAPSQIWADQSSCGRLLANLLDFVEAQGADRFVVAPVIMALPCRGHRSQGGRNLEHHDPAFGPHHFVDLLERQPIARLVGDLFLEASR